MNSSRRSGTTLVEVLVVIVVFLVGILAVAQIFPGGLQALRNSQFDTIATSLGRAEIEMLKNHVDQMPDDIVPVQYVWNGSQLVISVQPGRFPNDLGPGPYGNMDANGDLYDAGNDLIGDWQTLTGPNITRRVLGEGKIIPAPKQVGAYFGSLLTLQFAPVVYNANYVSIFQVFGNDMTKRVGVPPTGYTVGTGEYWISNGNATIELPPNNYSSPVSYSITVTGYLSGVRQELNQVVPLPAGDPGVHHFADIGFFPGISNIEPDSVKVQREFVDVSSLANDDWGSGAGNPNPDPYEYKLLSPQRGLVLFNPSGYNYFVRQPDGSRQPLLGRVSYDVDDWRILNEEFQVPASYQYRLAVNALKVARGAGPDGLPNQGIGVQAPDSTGTYNNADLVIEDPNTGGVVMFQEGTNDPTKTSFTVNKSTGLVTFLDADTGTPGLQVTEFLPGAAVGQNFTIDNRTLRALYMGKNEFAVQVMKPAAVFSETWGLPGASSFYVGGSVSGVGNVTRVYFAPKCAGRLVSLGEIYYFNPQGIEVGPVQLTARVEGSILDSLNLPYIDVSQYFPDFNGFDYNYPSPVKEVKGSSVAVRVLWNPNKFNLSADPAVNMDSLQTWMQGWRRTTVETYLQREN